MQRASAPPRRAVWGLWLFLTAASIGFVVLLGGLFAPHGRAMMAGAAIMAFATLVYLFIHFWTTSMAALTPSPVAQPTPRAVSKPVPVPSANFEALMSRAPEAGEAVAAPAVREERLVAVANGGMTRTHVVPAAQRRSEWIGGLPIIKQVLGEPAPVTSAARPGKSRGQCSNCMTILWAPLERPIRLRCPTCNKVAWLEK